MASKGGGLGLGAGPFGIGRGVVVRVAPPQPPAAIERAAAPCGPLPDRRFCHVAKLAGRIGPDDAINRKAVARMLATAGGKPLWLQLDSGGGTLSEAESIAKILGEHAPGVAAVTEDGCDSAAAMLYAAASWRLAAPGSKFLFHPVAAGQLERYARATADQLRKRATDLDATGERFAEFLAQRCGQPADRIHELIRKERRIPAAEAQALGLVHYLTVPGDDDLRERLAEAERRLAAIEDRPRGRERDL